MDFRDFDAGEITMTWKDILKEDKVFEEVKKEYVDFIKKLIKTISEEDLGWPMYSYFDGLMPEYVEDSERLKTDIKDIIEDFGHNEYVDTKELKSMLDKLNQKENLRNLIDSLNLSFAKSVEEKRISAFICLSLAPKCDANIAP